MVGSLRAFLDAGSLERLLPRDREREHSFEKEGTLGLGDDRTEVRFLIGLCLWCFLRFSGRDRTGLLWMLSTHLPAAFDLAVASMVLSGRSLNREIDLRREPRGGGGIRFPFFKESRASLNSLISSA